ncbi:zinc metalloprotease HtpX [Hyphomicrobium methylovorum]|uniref:zinc metalloprotease HtpX n=1 Tax=Hyphomicrobium methylovorum TaxID=84 RepID=UPI0015E69420|nr:zinc metalloprotease HtpX [Hyphomicrobium methylovorum]MBA2126347.1 zinc metalloprotease HtpX [Hyphomicrobium methylovorum]
MPMNYTKTAVLLATMTAIFVVLGAAVGGKGGMLVAFAIALVMNLVSLWKSDSVVLRMFNAREVTASTAPELVGLVRDLARRAELPMPRVYIMDNPQPNAFATGRSPAKGAVCASTGLLEALNREELAGVMAHELAHIKNRDTLTMAVAATIGGAVSMVAQYLQFGMLFGGNRGGDRGGLGMIGTLAAIIVAPMAAGLVQMAISRSREYQADRMGAMICGNPYWLSSALRKIEGLARRVDNPEAEAVPAAAHMFIINPLNGHGMDNLFATHPSMDNRVAALEALAREMGVTARSTSGDAFGAGEAPRTSGGSDGVWIGGQNHSKPPSPWG